MISMDQELQQYLSAIAAARQEPCTGTENLGMFLDHHLEQEQNGSYSNNSHVSLSYMKDIEEAVEFFTEFCVLLFAKGHGAPYTPPGRISNLLYGRPKEEQRKLLETCLPLSMWDKHRIRRALLRFQLYCELFHQPGNPYDNEGDWEERVSEQELFWLRYEWWEVEEVKCIYQLLFFSLALDCPRENLDSETQISLEGSLQERGLPQLRHFLDGSNTTTFGENHLRKFLSRAFYGFSKADPDDFNYFSLPRPLYRTHFAAAMIKPPGTYRSLTSGVNKSRRWEPSPYPGVQLEHLTDPTLNPALPAECRLLKSKPQELKKFVRLIGWVFWDSKKLYDWVEFGMSFYEFRLVAGDFDQDWDNVRNGKPFRWANRNEEKNGEVQSMYRKRNHAILVKDH
jgi:hypothetical protein